MLKTFVRQAPEALMSLRLAPRLALVAVMGAVALVSLPAGTADAAGSVACSASALVGAIDVANASPGADTLTLTLGCTYVLRTADNDANGLPVITGDITIRGRGATVARAEAAPGFRIFLVADSGALHLQDLTLRRGRGVDCPVPAPLVAFCGGAIASAGTLTIDHSRVVDNLATGAAEGGISVEGGGILSAGTATISSTDISNNTASYTGVADASAAFGGGVGNEGSMSISHSALSHNTVSATGADGFFGDGGFAEGSAVASFGPLTVSHTTINKNVSLAPNAGSVRGAVLNGFSLTMTSSDVSGNTSTAPGEGEAYGGGIRSASGSTLHIQGSRITNNTVTATVTAGGGIDVRNDATADISSTEVSGNTSTAIEGGIAEGGGIRNLGTTTLRNDQIRANLTSGPGALGGGIINSPGSTSLTLIESSVRDNSAAGSGADGGGIWTSTRSGPLILTRSPIAGNHPNDCTPVSACT